jgi:hypothetical protein
MSFCFVSYLLDDIYLYGGMKFDTIPTWIIPHKKIVLEEKIKCGKFADIFKARYDTKLKGLITKTKTN